MENDIGKLCRWCGKERGGDIHDPCYQLGDPVKGIKSHPFESYEQWAEGHIQQFKRDVDYRAYELKVERAAREIVHE